MGHGTHCSSTPSMDQAASKHGCPCWPSRTQPTMTTRLLLQSSSRSQISTRREKKKWAASSYLGFEYLPLPPPTTPSSQIHLILYLQGRWNRSQHNPKLWLNRCWAISKSNFHFPSTWCFAIPEFLWALLTEGGMAVNQQVGTVSTNCSR